MSPTATRSDRGTILSLNALNNTMWMPLVAGLAIALVGFARDDAEEAISRLVALVGVADRSRVLTPVGFIALMVSVIWFVAVVLHSCHVPGPQESLGAEGLLVPLPGRTG